MPQSLLINDTLSLSIISWSVSDTDFFIKISMEIVWQRLSLKNIIDNQYGLFAIFILSDI